MGLRVGEKVGLVSFDGQFVIPSLKAQRALASASCWLMEGAIVCLKGCQDGRLDGCECGCLDGCDDGFLNGCLDGCVDGCLDGCLDGWLDGVKESDIVGT